MQQKEIQKVFQYHPNLMIVHHKRNNIKGVHISYVTRTNALPLLLEEALLKGYERYIFEYTLEESNKKIDLLSLFNKRNKKDNSARKFFIEIGFGDGENSFKIAQENPEINYLAFDVYLHGVAQYTKHLLDANLDNVIIVRYDAEDFIAHSIADNSIDGFNIFFPDPWIKRKQSKRRIINSNFVSILTSKLVCGGIIHTATDIKEYADTMMKVLSAQSGLKNLYGKDNFAPNKQGRFVTTFEEKGNKENRKSYDLIFQKEETCARS